jgi:predicted DNA-binding protein
MAQRPLNASGGVTPTTGFRVPRPTLDRVDREARKRGITRSQLVRELIERGLDQPRRTA